MRQMVVWFAVFYTMKWCKSFYVSLSTTSPPPINPKTTSSISMANYSPLSSGRGWGWGWKTLVSRLCFPYTISPLIINNATLIIVLSRNSVRVVPLIARGWRGTSLPRVNVRKEIQRRRCWAFFWRHVNYETFHGGLLRKSATPTALFHAKHTLTQGSLHYRLATLGYQKHNTYGVETCIL